MGAPGGAPEDYTYIMAKDYYGLLGVSKTASDEEIKSAYRKLAKKYHPDLYSTASESEKKAAEEKFKEINHAYSVLSDPDKRAAFDAYGDENGPAPGQGGGFGGFGGFGAGGSRGGFGFDMDDIFSTIFSGFGGHAGGDRRANAPQRGADIRIRMTLTFEEAAFGVQKKVSVRRTEVCSDCGGSGAKPGTGTKTCSNCHGTGHVTRTQSTPFGQFSSTGVCPVCKGKGKIVTDPCKTCGGSGMTERAREITINIPAGIDNGQTITYSGEGNAGVRGGERGSLIVEIAVRPHKLFKRRGSDLNLQLPLTIAEAALGCTVSVPTLRTPQDLRIPEGTQSGTVFKLKGCGIKKLRSQDNGDLYVTVVVEVPKTLTREQRDLMRKLDAAFELRQFPQKREYRDKL